MSFLGEHMHGRAAGRSCCGIGPRRGEVGGGGAEWGVPQSRLGQSRAQQRTAHDGTVEYSTAQHSRAQHSTVKVKQPLRGHGHARRSATLLEVHGWRQIWGGRQAYQGCNCECYESMSTAYMGELCCVYQANTNPWQ